MRALDPARKTTRAECQAHRVASASILKREIKRSSDSILSQNKVQEIYEKTEDKRILVLDDNYSSKKIVESYPEPLFVIKQNTDNKHWHINTVGLEGFAFKSRMYLPQSWAGKEGEELAKITGVLDAVFCHNDRFVAVAKSKEGAIKMAKLAIESASK